MIIDIVNLINTMSKYKLVKFGDIEIKSKTSQDFNHSKRGLVDSVELLIYVKYNKKSSYTIWVRNSSVIIYWPGEVHHIAVFSYDNVMISSLLSAKDAYENCMSILRKNTLEIERTKGKLGKVGDIEYLIPDFKKAKESEDSDKEESKKRFKELSPETIKILRKMLKENIEEENLDNSEKAIDNVRRYIGSICDKCGEMSNHDEIDEDICIHCHVRGGTWKHIYEPQNIK